MATQRPFRFAGGVLAVQSRAEWVEQMRKTEAQGFATLLLADHYYWRIISSRIGFHCHPAFACRCPGYFLHPPAFQRIIQRTMPSVDSHDVRRRGWERR